jgi:hypothetical protein
MKRDMDLIRNILLAIDKSEELNIENKNREEIVLHVHLLGDAGLIIYDPGKTLIGGDPSIYRITWNGYEFLEAAKDDNRWARAKEITSNVGSLTFEILKPILIGLAKESIKTLVPGIPIV